jgi:transposase
VADTIQCHFKDWTRVGESFSHDFLRSKEKENSEVTSSKDGQSPPSLTAEKQFRLLLEEKQRNNEVT